MRSTFNCPPPFILGYPLTIRANKRTQICRRDLPAPHRLQAVRRFYPDHLPGESSAGGAKPTTPGGILTALGYLGTRGVQTTKHERGVWTAAGRAGGGNRADASSAQRLALQIGDFVMQCPRCRHENPPQANFCMECGTRFSLQCTKCGTELPAGARFCVECGQAVSPPASSGQPRYTSPESYTPKHLAEKILTSRSALEGERKQVTVLFADLKGSMELLADRDPEEARRLLDPVLERMMEAVHHYEGTVNQVMGDGIMALFGVNRFSACGAPAGP